MIAGGGTGGHIYPAIAIAQEFLARDAARRVVFVGTERGLEKTIVPKAGFPLELISVGGLKGKGLTETIKSLVRLPVGIVQALGLIGKYRPDVVYRNPVWAELTALREGRVFCVPEAYLGRPGPRLVEGVRALREIVERIGPRAAAAR